MNLFYSPRSNPCAKGASITMGFSKSTRHRARVGRADSTGAQDGHLPKRIKCLPKGRLQGTPHMKQGFPHLGTAGAHPTMTVW